MRIKMYLSALLLIFATNVVTTPAHAHGRLWEPPARQVYCQRFKSQANNSPQDGSGISDPSCRQLIAGSGRIQTLAIDDPDTSFSKNIQDFNIQAAVEQAIPNGKLCSGNNPIGIGADGPRTDWFRTRLVPKDGKIDVMVKTSQGHSPSSFKFYLSKPSYHYQHALGWQDVGEPVLTQAAPDETGPREWHFKIPTEGRTGDVVLFMRWQREVGSTEGFYNCSDITIGDDGSGGFPWYQQGAFVLPGMLPAVGDTIRFSLMSGATKAGQEVIDEKLPITGNNQAPAVWSHELANLLHNKYSHLLQVGIKSGNTVTYDANKVHDNQVFLKSDQDFAVMEVIPAEGGTEPTPPPEPGAPITATLNVPATVASGGQLNMQVSGHSATGRQLKYVWAYVKSKFVNPSTAGQTSVSLTAIHVDKNTSTGDIYVRVSDDAGHEITTPAQQATILAGTVPVAPPPVARITGSTNVTAGQQFSMSGTSSSGANTPLTYRWEAASFTASTSTASAITLTAPNVTQVMTGEVKLTVTDSKNQPHSVTQVVTVTPASGGGGGGNCATAWNAQTAYPTPGVKVSYGGYNYEVAHWTQNDRPDLNFVLTGSAKPWRRLDSCTP